MSSENKRETIEKQIRDMEKNAHCPVCSSNEIRLRNFEGDKLYEVSCTACNTMVLLKPQRHPSVITKDYFKGFLKSVFGHINKEESFVVAMADCGCWRIAPEELDGKKLDLTRFLEKFKKDTHKIDHTLKFEVLEFTILSFVKTASSFTEVLTFRVPPYIKTKVEKYASDCKMPLAECLRSLVEMGVENNLINKNSDEE